MSIIEKGTKFIKTVIKAIYYIVYTPIKLLKITLAISVIAISCLLLLNDWAFDKNNEDNKEIIKSFYRWAFFGEELY